MTTIETKLKALGQDWRGVVSAINTPTIALSQPSTAIRDDQARRFLAGLNVEGIKERNHYIAGGEQLARKLAEATRATR